VEEETVNDVYSEWLDSVSKLTRRTYKRAWRVFGQWMDLNHPDEYDWFQDHTNGHKVLCDFRDHLLDKGLATGTVAGLLTGLCSFIAQCRRRGLTTFHPENVAPKVAPVVDRSGPQRFEVEAIVQHVDQQAAQGDVLAIRDSAILRLLYVAALRRGEVVGLRVQDVDTAAFAVRAKVKNHAVPQDVYVGPQCMETIAAWLEVRGQEPGPLFIRLDKARDRDALEPLRGEAVGRMVGRRAQRAGVKHPVRPHGLRHSAATWAAVCTGPRPVQALGCWKTSAGSDPYIDGAAGVCASTHRRRAVSAVEF
jgi:integrase